MMTRSIAWLRNDLRLIDNPVLHLAAKARSCVPVVCLDPKSFGPNTAIHPGWCALQTPKLGYLRGRFLLESVSALQRDLRAIGSDLLVLVGSPETLLPPLVASDELIYSTEVGTEESSASDSVKRDVNSQGGTVTELWGSQTLYDSTQLPFVAAKLPEPFTAFRNVVENPESAALVPEPLPVPNLPPFLCESLGLELTDIDSALQQLGVEVGINRKVLDLNATPSAASSAQSTTAFTGGEQAAKQRLEAFVHHGLGTYKQTRDSLMGEYFSSKMSPWLAVGCISPRSVYHRVVQYEEEHGETIDTYWLGFELKWRDFFRFFAVKYGASLYHIAGPAKPKKKVPWERDKLKFQRWCDGQTGIPFVDANMRELSATGYMSNRGRQCVASFLTQDLRLDWRWGAIWFEHCLLDHDVASNYGNWACAAGVGMKGQRVNKFNMAKQAQQYDKDAVYIKTWIPEVADLPAELALSPWTAPELPPNYPSPLVEPTYAPEAYQNPPSSLQKDKAVALKSGTLMEKKRMHYGRKAAFNAS